MFRQYPLNGLNTFEDELLFFMAGVIDLISGLNDSAYINKTGAYNTGIRCLDQFDRAIHLSNITRIFTKYGRSLSGLFEIRLIKQRNGRWKLSIKENMDRISEDVQQFIQ